MEDKLECRHCDWTCSNENRCPVCGHPLHTPKQTPKADSEKNAEMYILNQVRTQVDDCTDYVSDFFVEQAKLHHVGKPSVEVSHYENSNERLSILKIEDKTVAIVVETRTELNHVEFIFSALPAPLSKVDNHIGDDLEQVALDYATDIHKIAYDEFFDCKADFIAGANWRTQHPDPAMVEVKNELLEFIKDIDMDLPDKLLKQLTRIVEQIAPSSK